MVIDLPQHAVRIQSLTFGPFVDPEKSPLPKKIEFQAFSGKIKEIKKNLPSHAICK